MRVYVCLMLLLFLIGFSSDRAAPADSSVGTAPRTDLYGDPIPAGAMVRLGSTRFRMHGYAFGLQIAFSPDNRMLVTMGDRHLYFWEAATGKLLRRIDNAGDRFAFAPDGKSFVTGSQDDDKKGILELWETHSGKKLKTTHYPDEAFPTALVFPANGKVLVTGNSDGTLRLWDMTLSKEISRTKVGSEALRRIGLSSDGSRIAILDPGRMAKLPFTS